jgi:undecaprenyl-diphosphatase
MRRYGARAVVVSRLIAGIRTKVAIISGSTEMSLMRYIVADGIGAAIWAVTVGLLGYVFSASVQRLVDGFGSSSGALGSIALVIVGVVGLYLAVRYVLKHRPSMPESTDAPAATGAPR